MFGNLHEKIVSFLIKRFLGPYVKDFNVDQFSVGLHSGRGGLKDVNLNCETLNYVLSDQNVNIEIAEGQASTISVSVPWFKILQDSCQVDVNELYVCLRPKTNRSGGHQMQDSLRSSIIIDPKSLVEEFSKSEIIVEEYNEPMTAYTDVEETINSVIFNVQLHLRNTVIRLEPDIDSGLEFGAAVEFHIDTLQILPGEVPEGSEHANAICKKIVAEGIRCYLDLYSKASVFHSRDATQQPEEDGLVLIAEIRNKQEIGILLNMDMTEESGSPISVEVRLDQLYAILTPIQLNILDFIFQDFMNAPTKQLTKSMYKQRVDPNVNYQGWTSSDSMESSEPESSLFTMAASVLQNSGGELSLGAEKHSLQEVLRLNAESKQVPLPDSNVTNEASLETNQSKVHFQLGNAVIILLHKDVLVLNPNMNFQPSSILQLKQHVQSFFDLVGNNALKSFNKSGFELKLSNFIAEVEVKNQNAGSVVSCVATVQNLEVNERLSRENLPMSCKEAGVITPILNTSDCESTLHFDRVLSETFDKESNKASLRVNIPILSAELDISVVDRLTCLLQPTSVLRFPKTVMPNNETSPFDLEFKVQKGDLAIRIPIVSKPQQTPYWIRNVFSDFFEVTFDDLTVKTNGGSSDVQGSQFELQLNEGHLFYRPSPSADQSVLLATLSSGLTATTTVNPPRVIADADYQLDEEYSKLKDFRERTVRGDATELSKMIEKSSQHVLCNVDIKLSSIDVQLTSKDTFDTVCNRITEDLLVWAPRAPTMSKLDTSLSTAFNTHSQYDSDGEAFYSFFGDLPQAASAQLEKPVEVRTKPKALPKGQSGVTLKVTIDEGTFTVVTPLKNMLDETNSNAKGQVTLMLGGTTVFLVSGYKGNESLSYGCVHSKSIAVYHCRDLDSVAQAIPVTDPRLQLVFHRSEDSLKSSFDYPESISRSPATMLSLSATMEKKDERITNISVNVGLQHGTLHHYIALPEQDWVSQLSAFFTPISPTVEPSVLLSSVHLQLTDIKATYAPLNHNTRLLLGLEQAILYVYVDQELTSAYPKDKTTIVHFIAQNSALYLTNQKQSWNLNDYVRIMNMDLLKLVLKLSGDTDNRAPDFDLEASNGMLQFTACQDSVKMLIDTLGYILNDDDLVHLEDYSRLKRQGGGPSLEPVFTIRDVDSMSTVCFHQNLSEAMQSLRSSAVSPAPGNISVEQTEDEKIQNLHTTTAEQPEQAAAKSHNELYPSLSLAPECDDDPMKQLVASMCDLTPTISLDRDSGRKLSSLTNEDSFDESFVFVEDWFSETGGSKRSKDVFNSPQVPVQRVVLKDISLTVSLYGGYDFSYPVLASKQSYSGRRKREDSTCSNKSENEQNCTLGRKYTDLVEFVLSELRFQHEVYPDNTVEAARQVFAVPKFEIKDKVASSGFKRILYPDLTLVSRLNPYMLLVEANHVRPDVNINSPECDLSISLQPIQINLDQETLSFFIHFFRGIIPSDEPTKATNTSSAPVQGESENVLNPSTSDSETSEGVMNSKPIYFRNVAFYPDVPLKLDFEGKLQSENITSGPLGWLATLVMGLGRLDNAKIVLTSLHNDNGILGIENVVSYLVNSWQADVTNNQMPKILKNVDFFLPANSFVKLYEGSRNLFVLPVQQYKKDGQILYGLQRGVTSFSSSSASAVLQLTNRLVRAVQTAAEVTYDIVSSGQGIEEEKTNTAWRGRPAGIVEGVRNACTVVADGVGTTATNVVEAATAGKARKGIPGAIGGVVREIPATLVKPFILATAATSNVLKGFEAEINPELKEQINDKWKK